MARTFHHLKVLAFEMGRCGTALLGSDQRSLRIGTTVPYTAVVKRIVRIRTDVQSGVRQVQEQA
jgi:hypothetical protein